MIPVKVYDLVPHHRSAPMYCRHRLKGCPAPVQALALEQLVYGKSREVLRLSKVQPDYET